MMLYPNLLDVLLLVDSAGVLFKVDRSSNILSEALNELDVDIRLHESSADLLEHVIDHLDMTNNMGEEAIPGQCTSHKSG